ncbi:MAG: hypothetical protein KF744_12445 [Taibaiella sp.]|nr:hypothetical protein [Taibaiella sp.]
MSLQKTNTQNPSPFRDGVAPRVSKFDSARLLYMAGDTTQKSIAATVGVSERTMHSWIKDNGWDRLRHASRTAPAIIAENMFSQIVELQNDIASREEGKRYPTMQEAELTRKLCLSIDRMKSAPALSQTMQVLRLFRSFANSYGDRDFRLTLNRVIEHFLEGNAKDGYMPYQIEYGTKEPLETNSNTEGPPTSTDQEMKESFPPAKEGQIIEKRSLFDNQGGNNSAHNTPPANEELAVQETDNTGNPNLPEANDSKHAENSHHKASQPTSDSKDNQQKPEVKRKFSHASLNKIASS